MRVNQYFRAIGLAIGILAAFVTLDTSLAAEDPKLGPGADLEKLVLVHGWSREELGQISVDFLELYPHVAPIYAQLRVDDIDPDLVLLSFPRDMPWDSFLFLINYIHYANNYELSKRAISALGIASLANSDFPVSSGVGFFYVPEDDDEFDQIYVQTEERGTFRIPLSSLEWVSVSESRQSAMLAQLMVHAR